MLPDVQQECTRPVNHLNVLKVRQQQKNIYN